MQLDFSVSSASKYKIHSPIAFETPKFLAEETPPFFFFKYFILES